VTSNVKCNQTRVSLVSEEMLPFTHYFYYYYYYYYYNWYAIQTKQHNVYERVKLDYRNPKAETKKHGFEKKLGLTTQSLTTVAET